MAEVEHPEKPTKLLWLVPIFMGFLGGILMYIAVKDENKEMANNAMLVSVLSMLGWILAYVLIIIFMGKSLNPF